MYCNFTSLWNFIFGVVTLIVIWRYRMNLSCIFWHAGVGNRAKYKVAAGYESSLKVFTLEINFFLLQKGDPKVRFGVWILKYITNQIFWNYDSVHSWNGEFWNFGPITNPQDFILGVSQGPWADCESRHARRRTAMLPVSRKERLRQRLRARQTMPKKYGTNVIKYEWLLISLDAKGSQELMILSSFSSFFLCFLWGSCRRRLPHSSVPSWKQRPMGAGGLDALGGYFGFFRKVWSSDPDWYSNPPKLIFCDQSQIRESLRTRTEHWNQKPEVNISIKATQT